MSSSVFDASIRTDNDLFDFDTIIMMVIGENTDMSIFSGFGLLVVGGFLLFAVLFYVIRKTVKRPGKHHILTPTPPQPDDPVDDFVCFHLGDKGTIASRGGVTVRVTKK